jgi:hypothetical protein
MEVVDRLDLMELVARFSHAIDQRDWDAFPQIFTEDVIWEIPDGDRGWNGLSDLLSDFRSRSHPLAHHFASTVLDELPDDKVRAQSKVLLILAGGVALPALCVDTCVRTPAGWRIEHRLTTTLTLDEMRADAPGAWNLKGSESP